ncbi:MAG: sulfurtransferase [Burkholderiales bacterium]
MRFTTLVSSAQLAPHLDDPQWVICDCRHDLTNTEAGKHAYAEAHIPGARFVHLDHDLSAPLNGSNGRHPLPDPEKFRATLGRLGIDSSKQVVAYDAAGGVFAARLWWMLRWQGHINTAVLDGGFPLWLAENHPVTAQVPVVHPVQFRGESHDALKVDARFVEAHLEAPDMLLMDARAADRFHGQNETLDPVAGHIPGALSHFFQNNLDQGRFKSAAKLRQEFLELLDKTPPHNVVHQCGSGVTACHNLLAMEIAGLAGSRLYPGSWSEWCANQRRPIVTPGR